MMVRLVWLAFFTVANFAFLSACEKRPNDAIALETAAATRKFEFNVSTIV